MIFLDLESDWPDQILPAEFVLASQRLEKAHLPIEPPGIFKGAESWWVRDSYRGTEWDWTRLSVFARYVATAKAFRNLAKHWKTAPTHVWMTLADYWPESEEYHWILLEGEVAAMVAGDIAESALNFAILLITEDGTVFASQGGPWSMEELFLSEKILPGGEEFQWPDWATVITSRHRDKGWGYELEEVFRRSYAGGEYSFYMFCVESWRDYVFTQLQSGTDEAVRHVLETMDIIDRMGYGPSCQNITVLDDLAMVFYRDHPPAWILRLYQFMNPLDLWIDMTTQEGMNQLRLKAMQRDSGAPKKRKGK